MNVRLRADWRACLLDSTAPGSLVHDILAGAPLIPRAGDPPGGLYEMDCSEADCEELRNAAVKYCPEALSAIETALRQRRT